MCKNLILTCLFKDSERLNFSKHCGHKLLKKSTLIIYSSITNLSFQRIEGVFYRANIDANEPVTQAKN